MEIIVFKHSEETDNKKFIAIDTNNCFPFICYVTNKENDVELNLHNMDTGLTYKFSAKKGDEFVQYGCIMPNCEFEEVAWEKLEERARLVLEGGSKAFAAKRVGKF